MKDEDRKRGKKGEIDSIIWSKEKKMRQIEMTVMHDKSSYLLYELTWAEFMILISDCYSEHVTHADRKTGLFAEKYPIWDCLSILSNALNRTNNKDCSLRAHLFLNYHLI